MRSRFCRMPSCDGSRPMGQPGTSAGLQTRRPGWPKNAPWPGRISARRCVMGRLLLGVGRQKSEALLSAPPGISATCPASEGCRTAGCERNRCSAGCHATPGDENPLLRLQRGTIPKEYGIGLTACAGREVETLESDCKAVRHLSTQIVIKTGESNFHFERRFTLRVVPSSTLSNSTNGCRDWQRRI
jgi:hypothetical protein